MAAVLAYIDANQNARVSVDTCHNEGLVMSQEVIE